MKHQLMTFLISLAHSHFKNVSQYFCAASTYSASVSFLACALSVIVTERDGIIYVQCNSAGNPVQI